MESCKGAQEGERVSNLGHRGKVQGRMENLLVEISLEGCVGRSSVRHLIRNSGW